MFQHAPFPKLKGKAAEVRHFVPALRHALACIGVDETKHHEHLMRLQLECATKIEEILDAHASSYKLTDEVGRVFRQAVEAFVRSNSALGSHFHPQGKMLFTHTVKMHYMLHIAEISKHINPRLGWCYKGEDMMHKVKVIVQSSQRGSGPTVVPRKVLLKYAQGLGMSMEANVWR